MEPVVSFEKVCFSYTDLEVLHNVTFAVESKTFLGVVGPNGGGKTTLLRLMLGLEHPARGTIAVLGESPEKARRHIGYVMQHMQYDERFPATVLDIALMGRAGQRFWGPYSRKDHSAARDALGLVNMADLGNRSFAALSGGQRQRVLIAQALAVEPRILVLDEPTANIDLEGEEAIHRLLSSLAHHLTVISVSHNLTTVLNCVSHVLCVNKTADINRLDQMNPQVLAHAWGSDLAVLHHALSCQVFDKPHDIACDSGRGDDRACKGAV